MIDQFKRAHCNNCNFQLSIFKYLDKDQLDLINSSRIQVAFKEGETIFKQGTALTHIACLTGGKVKIFLEGLSTKNLILKIAIPTEMFGGPGLFTDYLHHYSAYALKPSTACFIGIKEFETVVRENHDFALELIKHINLQSQTLHKRLINLTQKQMPGRLADAILYLSEKIHKSNDFETALTRQDIADLSAMSKESAIRIMKEFKDSKMLDVEHNHFKILDPEALKKISSTG